MSGDRPHDPTTQENQTPEGHTPEKPAPSEIGARGTPGAAMTPDVPHPADADLVEHGHAEPPLGPIDWPAWGYALVGIAAGTLVVVAFRVAIS